MKIKIYIAIDDFCLCLFFPISVFPFYPALSQSLVAIQSDVIQFAVTAFLLSLFLVLRLSFLASFGWFGKFICVSHLPLWNSLLQMLQLHCPSGGDVNGGDKQYIWYLWLRPEQKIEICYAKKKLDKNHLTHPRSQSSQKSNWSSLSEVPQIEQYLHSIHCHR